MSKTIKFLKAVKLIIKTLFSSEIREKVSGCCACQSEEVLQGRMERDRQRRREV